MTYKKVSKHSWRYQAVQWFIKRLVGKVGKNENIIYPFNDLVGHGAMVLPYYKDEEGILHVYFGCRHYGNPERMGFYSTLIGYAGSLQHLNVVYNLLKDRGGLAAPDVDKMKLHDVHLATIDNEFKDGHQTLTSVYAYEVNSAEKEMMLEGGDGSLMSAKFTNEHTTREMIRNKLFAQPHEAKMIVKLLEKL